MTWADGIILGIVFMIVSLILWNRFKKKDEGVCAGCSYAKTCSKSECFPTKKSE